MRRRIPGYNAWSQWVHPDEAARASFPILRVDHKDGLTVYRSGYVLGLTFTECDRYVSYHCTS